MARRSGMAVRGVRELRRNLQRIEREAVRAAEGELRTIAEEVEQGSVARAPVDTGQLEETHRTTEERRPRNLTLVVSAGPARAPDGSDYAVKMHEGDYDLGPRSAAKNAGQTPHVGEGVGRKFMKRAFDAATRDALQRLARAAGRAVRLVVRK